jgi:hypothetical protein
LEAPVLAAFAAYYRLFAISTLVSTEERAERVESTIRLDGGDVPIAQGHDLARAVIESEDRAETR